jgi:hypothetical protein
MESQTALSFSESDREQLQALTAKVNAILPPRYVGCFEEVSPTSMGSAKLKRDAQGRVVWGEIWTTFCHLALAGGPPHRGSWLEPVPRSNAEAHPAEQHAIVAEIERAIRLATELKTVASPIPGWVGVRCYDEDMAAWLLRAIVAENVAARRDRNVLYVPAGPNFQIEKEVKNVIVSLAKSCHYLLDHTEPVERPSGLARSLVEPVTADEIAASPDRYNASVADTEHRIREHTGLETVRGNAIGWIGIRCASEEMAVWILRAVIVEDVLARRECDVVYVPVSMVDAPQRGRAKVVAAVSQAYRLWQLQSASQPKQ